MHACQIALPPLTAPLSITDGGKFPFLRRTGFIGTDRGLSVSTRFEVPPRICPHDSPRMYPLLFRGHLYFVRPQGAPFSPQRWDSGRAIGEDAEGGFGAGLRVMSISVRRSI